MDIDVCQLFLILFICAYNLLYSSISKATGCLNKEKTLKLAFLIAVRAFYDSPSWTKTTWREMPKPEGSVYLTNTLSVS